MEPILNVFYFVFLVLILTCLIAGLFATYDGSSRCERLKKKDPLLFYECENKAYREVEQMNFDANTSDELYLKRKRAKNRIACELFKQELYKKEKLEEEKKNRELARKAEIAQKTVEIEKQNKHIETDIQQYKELYKQTSCTVDKIKPCNRVVDLFATLDNNTIDSMKKSLSSYQKIAEEKKDILNKIERLAQLYRDIGNPTAAENIMKRIHL